MKQLYQRYNNVKIKKNTMAELYVNCNNKASLIILSPLTTTSIYSFTYFSNRLQFVEYNGYVSSCANIMCGVPQGSILGPLFFLLYINDIINTSTILQLILFADDTNVFVSHKDKDCLTNILNAELNKLSIWFRANRLSLNLKKTKFIVFKPCQKRTNQTIQLLINSQKLIK